MKRNEKIILLFIFAVGFVLRINNLSGRSLWTDEFFTLFQSGGHGTDIGNLLDYLSKQKRPKVLTAQRIKSFLKNSPEKSVKDVNKGLLRTDTHPPLYFWIMHFWMKCFGDNAFSIRFFSLLMGMSAILLAYLVCSCLFNIKAGIFGALFVSVSAFSVRYSQEARSYALIMAIGLLAWLFLLRFEKRDKGRDLFWFSVFSSLGFYAHYFYAFISIAQFIYFSFIYINRTLKIRRFYLAFLSSLLLFAPWFLILFFKGYNFRNAEWIFGYPGLRNKIYWVFSGINRYFFATDKFAEPNYILFAAGVSLFIFIVIFTIKKIGDRYPWQAFFCLLMFLVPLSAMLFIDIIEYGALLKQERFWMFSFLGLIPAMGYFLGYLFSKSKLAVSVIILFMLISSVSVSRAQFGPAPREASSWINKESENIPSAVIVYNIRSAVFAQAYYLDGDIFMIPVSDENQMFEAIRDSSAYAKKLFFVRHFHRTDASLMDQPFMGVKDLGAAFKFKAEFDRDDIRVSEYVK